MKNSGTPVKRTDTGFGKVKSVIAKVNKIINSIGKWLYRLRKPVMAAPVVYYALKLASYNNTHLPEQVGINLQSTGEFAQTISRNMAVMVQRFCAKASVSVALSVRRLEYSTRTRLTAISRRYWA